MTDKKTDTTPNSFIRFLGALALIFSMSFGMMCGIDYAGKNFKGPKPDPKWTEQQDKVCHAQCVARWEVQP